MKSVAIFSLKGGVGKSAIAVNLAHIAATSGGRRTLLWDLDTQGAATFLTEAVPSGRTRARAALAGDAPLSSLVVPSRWPNLSVLPADRSLRRIEGDLAQSDKSKIIRKHLKSLGENFDRVIIDCPPGLSELADRLFRAVDLLLVPLIPTPLSLRTLEQLQAELGKNHGGGPALLPLWSMVDRRRKLHRDTVDSQPDWLSIPYASGIEAMAVHQAPIAAIAASTPAARAFARLWSAVEAKLLRP